MFVLSVDLGSTNFKAVVLKIEESDKEASIEVIGKVRKKTIDFAIFIKELLNDYNIEKNKVERIVATGTGSSFIDDRFDGIDVIKVNEFDAVAYGGLILAGKDKGNVVSIGTGTTIVYSDMNKTNRLGGTGLGGGALVGIGNAILRNNADDEIVDFNSLIDMSKKGNRSNIDLTIGDISRNDIGDMSKDITAANFARIKKQINKEDYIDATVNMILENISLIVKAVCDESEIIYIGTMVADDYIRERLLKISEYTGNNIKFVNNSEYAIAIGAWEYYLLNLRKNY